MTSHSMRYSWQVMYASVFALVIRDIQKKFIKTINTERSFGLLWVVLEPTAHIAIWMVLRIFLGGNSMLTVLPTPLFILLGVIPFLLFRNIISSSKGAIKGNKGFYLFRQVKPIDPIIAKLISEFMITVFIFLIMLAILSWFGTSCKVYNFSFLLFNTIIYLGFLLGVSIIIAILCFFFNFMISILGMINRLFYIFCGIFFSADMLPKSFRAIILYNPVFQFIELARESFRVPFSYIPYASSAYLIKSSVITLSIGIGLYLALYQKIMIEIEQR
ncbi:Capsule polysaccharide export inner-membrane protein ctrC [Legionella busanensis]|uniref:Capsule polysaccharide export inner-membrane protein ctrC n=1 Tax=Legionella busanensis TaxID=190655 RepID=A0A378JM56_9GAMM|nr:ABC transporter permease [Legionella busanensis]STX51383.1 Capsule polysaccharide export inner-membrane protein ctrC [Legionella busanensis]